MSLNIKNGDELIPVAGTPKVTKSSLELDKVENKTSAEIRDELTLDNVKNAMGDAYLDKTELLSTISALSTTQIRDSKTVEFDGTGKNLEKLVIEGKTEQNGTPSPSDPIEVKGVGDKMANLLDTSDMVKGVLSSQNPYNPASASSTTSLTVESGKITMTTNAAWGGCSNASYIPAKPNTKYYMYLDKSSSYGQWYIGYYNSSKTLISLGGVNTTMRTSPANTAYIRLTFQLSSAGTCTFSNIVVIESNEATPYIEYGSPKYKIPISCGGTTENVYLDAPLFDGEKADIVSGIASRIFKVKTFNGSEDWTVSSIVTSGYINVVLDNAVSDAYMSGTNKYTPSACNIEPSSSSFTEWKTNNVAKPMFVIFNSSIGLRIPISEISSLDAWKNYLASHNLNVVYQFSATTTKEPFDGVEIPTSVGKNTLTVGTDVTPAKVEVTSFGEYYSKAEVDKMLALRDAISVDASEAITSKLGGSSYLFDAATITFANATYSNHQVSISFRLKGTVKSSMKTSNYAFITVLGAIDSNIPKPKTQVWGVAAQFSKSNNFISSINTDGVVMVQTPGGTIADISDDTDLVITLSYMV